ncbi:hypothetical protein C8Q72DRAFT_821582 [Fomitopsis betulina]|nr:hypothetical protein C8Q72DRAFT_821582 [Fomitopsis betulina]
MRFSTIPLVLAGTTLAIQAGAVPLRVVVISSHQQVSTSDGHNDAENIVAAMPGPLLAPGFGAMRIDNHTSWEVIKAHHCGGSMRETFSAFANKVFGFPSGDSKHLQPNPEHPHHEPGRVSILPWFGSPNDNFADRKDVPMHHGRPMELVPVEPQTAQEDVGPVRIVHMSGPEDRPRRFHHRHGPFLRRMHFALMALGPWEGRAVAFVLGCGIGVLLRMMWVMGVVLVRAVSSRRSDDNVHEAVAVFDADAEEILVAPPQYTFYPEEKAPVAHDDKA